MESTSGSHRLKRSHSSNTRSQSVRRTSIREKNQISRREAREEGSRLRASGAELASTTTVDESSRPSSQVNESKKVLNAQGDQVHQENELRGRIKVGHVDHSNLEQEEEEELEQVILTFDSVSGGTVISRIPCHNQPSNHASRGGEVSSCQLTNGDDDGSHPSFTTSHQGGVEKSLSLFKSPPSNVVSSSISSSMSPSQSSPSPKVTSKETMSSLTDHSSSSYVSCNNFIKSSNVEDNPSSASIATTTTTSASLSQGHQPNHHHHNHQRDKIRETSSIDGHNGKLNGFPHPYSSDGLLTDESVTSCGVKASNSTRASSISSTNSGQSQQQQGSSDIKVEIHVTVNTNPPNLNTPNSTHPNHACPSLPSPSLTPLTSTPLKSNSSCHHSFIPTASPISSNLSSPNILCSTHHNSFNCSPNLIFNSNNSIPPSTLCTHGTNTSNHPIVHTNFPSTGTTLSDLKKLRSDQRRGSEQQNKILDPSMNNSTNCSKPIGKSSSNSCQSGIGFPSSSQTSTSVNVTSSTTTSSMDVKVNPHHLEKKDNSNVQSMSKASVNQLVVNANTKNTNNFITNNNHSRSPSSSSPNHQLGTSTSSNIAIPPNPSPTTTLKKYRGFNQVVGGKDGDDTGLVPDDFSKGGCCVVSWYLGSSRSFRSRQSVHAFRVMNVQGSFSGNRPRKHVIVLSISNENAFLMAIKGAMGRRKEWP